ncbi:hypothetical protein ACFYVL_13160 [Streptomyces sp. NPDC004111]|uniref:hypothetical protein n=1 Tax=Streptomyces sp. NPDC004111 TaxID=3364690 RepID=UPI0036C9CBBD
MRRKAMAALGALALGVSIVGLQAGPAAAKNVYQGSDYATHSYDGKSFWICDAENDSHKVWAGYYVIGSNTYHTANVIYGSDTSGVDCTLYGGGGTLSNIRVVEDKPGSSDNYYGAYHGYPVAGN